MEYEYPIDLDWSNEEMISVINFGSPPNVVGI
ncbi:Putative cytosolic protein [Staphylococcus aureus]|nr:Putative cytosolic protein [Staphylococcus aureus]